MASWSWLRIRSGALQTGNQAHLDCVGLHLHGLLEGPLGRVLDEAGTHHIRILRGIRKSASGMQH